MYDHTVQKQFCCYCLQTFITPKLLKMYVNDCFNVNNKQIIKMPKKGEYFRFKNDKRKIKSPFMIYADFESIQVPEGNGRQYLEDTYTNK